MLWDQRSGHNRVETVKGGQVVETYKQIQRVMSTSRRSSTQPALPEQQHWRDRITALSEGEFLKDLIFEESTTVIFLAVILALLVQYLFSILELWELGLFLLVCIYSRTMIPF